MTTFATPATLQPPKRGEDGRYFLTVTKPIQTPVQVQFADHWIPTDQLYAWASALQTSLLDELTRHSNWFSRPPRRSQLELLFSTWIGKNMDGSLQIFCKKIPDPPGPGKALWVLKGLYMTASDISPEWELTGFTPDPDPEGDTISLFGGEDEEDVGGSSSGVGGSGSGGDKEIQFDDIATSHEGAPIRIRNREWDTKRFLAKERVREARLKAQIAEHMASKEEARFHRLYGDLDDNESHFSDYDLDEESEAATDTEASDYEN